MGYPSKKRGEAKVRAWNETYRSGQHVHVTLDDGRSIATKTRSEAWTLGDGTPVVLLVGKSGGYLLDRVVACGATS